MSVCSILYTRARPRHFLPPPPSVFNYVLILEYNGLIKDRVLICSGPSAGTMRCATLHNIRYANLARSANATIIDPTIPARIRSSTPPIISGLASVAANGAAGLWDIWTINLAYRGNKVS